MLALSLQLILLIRATTDYADWDANFYLLLLLSCVLCLIIALLLSSYVLFYLFTAHANLDLPCIGSTVIFSLFTASFSPIGLACHHK